MFLSKYVILKSNGTLMPLIFSDILSHSTIAQAFPGFEVHSAGFVGIRNNRYATYGESLGLRTKPNHEEDTKVLNRYLGLDDL